MSLTRWPTRLEAEETRGLRGRAAQFFALLGTLFALLQLLFSTLDLANRTVNSIVSWLRYIIPALFVVGAFVAIYVLSRRKDRKQRLWAGAALALILLAGGGWGGWTYYEATRPPKAILIMVADFDGQQVTRKVDWGRRIYEGVKEQLSQLQLTQAVEVQRVFESYSSSDQARKAGDQHKATLVLWGWYDDVGVSPHFEVLRQAQSVKTNLPAQPQNIQDFDLYVRSGAKEMAYVVEVVLGLIHYTNGNYALADSLLTTALGNAPANAGMLGLEVPYFYRANARTFAHQPTAEIVDDLKAAVSNKPDWWPARWNLALAYANYCAPTAHARRIVDRGQEGPQPAPQRSWRPLAERGDLRRAQGMVPGAGRLSPGLAPEARLRRGPRGAGRGPR